VSHRSRKKKLTGCQMTRKIIDKDKREKAMPTHLAMDKKKNSLPTRRNFRHRRQAEARSKDGGDSADI